MATRVRIRNAEPNPRSDAALHLKVGNVEIPAGEEMEFTVTTDYGLEITEVDDFAEARKKAEAEAKAIKKSAEPPRGDESAKAKSPPVDSKQVKGESGGGFSGRRAF